MRKTSLAVGTTVSVRHLDMTGPVTANRRTMPDLHPKYDYVVELDFGDGPVRWGFGKDELDEVQP